MPGYWPWHNTDILWLCPWSSKETWSPTLLQFVQLYYVWWWSKTCFYPSDDSNVKMKCVIKIILSQTTWYGRKHNSQQLPFSPSPSFSAWVTGCFGSFFPDLSSFTCRVWFLHHSVHAGTSYLFTDLSFLGCPKVRMSQSQFCDCKILRTTKRAASHWSF